MQEVIHENQEKEFLQSYEVRNWNFSPRIYKILAISAIFNVVALVVFAQSNLLTKKGCDSPFVSTVCQVLDTVYVGNTLFGTDSDYVVRDYNETKIGEEENYEVTMIDVSDRLSYPANYFALANPEQYILDANGMVVPNNLNTFENLTPMDPLNPTMIPNNSTNLANTTPILPPQNNNPTVGKVPDSPFVFGDVNPTIKNPTIIGKNRKNRGGKKNPIGPDESPNELPKLEGENAENKTIDPKVDEKTATNSNPVESFKTNVKPLQDLGEKVSAQFGIDPLKETGNKFELKPFKVVLNTKLTKKLVKDEKGEEVEVVLIDGNQSKLIESAGDAQMVEIAKKAVAAVGDSGFFGYLYNLKMTDLKITLIQKDDKVFAAIESEQSTEQRAKTLQSGFNGLLVVADKSLSNRLEKSRANGNTGENDNKHIKDEIFLLKGVQKPTINGKTFIINFELPKDAVQEMIVRKIQDEAKKQKEAEAKQQNQNINTEQTVKSNPNAGK